MSVVQIKLIKMFNLKKKIILIFIQNLFQNNLQIRDYKINAIFLLLDLIIVN